MIEALHVAVQKNWSKLIQILKSSQRCQAQRCYSFLWCMMSARFHKPNMPTQIVVHRKVEQKVCKWNEFESILSWKFLNIRLLTRQYCIKRSNWGRALGISQQRQHWQHPSRHYLPYEGMKYIKAELLKLDGWTMLNAHLSRLVLRMLLKLKYFGAMWEMSWGCLAALNSASVGHLGYIANIN